MPINSFASILHDFHLLSHRHNSSLYLDVALPFTLRSSAMMYQRNHLCGHVQVSLHGLYCTNYFDDFGGDHTPDNSTAAFKALCDLLSLLGLQSSSNKDCPKSTAMVFLAIHLNTLAVMMSVTLNAFKSSFTAAALLLTSLISLTVSYMYNHFLLSHPLLLLALAPPASSCQLSSTLYMFIATRPTAFCPRAISLTCDGGVISFLNTVSIIKTSPWLTNPRHLSTNACNTGAALHSFLFLSPQIKPHCCICRFLQPQPPFCSPQHQVYKVQAIICICWTKTQQHTRTPSDTASQHSQLRSLPLVCFAAFLHISSGFIISASFLPPHTIRCSFSDFLHLQCLSQAPHISHRTEFSAFFPLQLPLWWCYLVKLLGDWRSDAFHVYLSLPLATCSQVADIMVPGLYLNCN